MNIKGVVINELSSSTNLEIAVSYFFLLYVHCSKENKGCEVDTYLQDLISFGSPLKTLFCCLILVLLLHIYVDYWFGEQTSLGTSHSWHSEPQLGFIRKIAFSLPLPLIPLQKNNTEIKIKKNVTPNSDGEKLFY